MPKPLCRRPVAAALVPLVLAACQTLPTPQGAAPAPSRAQPNRATTQVTGPEAPARNADAAAEPYRVFRGTGVLVKGQSGAPSGPAVAATPGGPVSLNFEAADLREVVRNILGDILNESYTIDPAVGGQVTLRTAGGIARDALPATLETLLRINGATMIKEEGIYKIVPQANAVRGNVTPQLGGSQRPLPQGFSVQIVPLRYVGVRDMQRLLEPFARDAQAVRADELRNLLILSGTERELRHLMETIAMFDVDWLAGMSAGVFTLQNADVKTVFAEFEKIVGPAQQSPLAGILRVVPIERMNALLVISPNPQYLEEAKKWIERLDRGGAGDGPRLYVYALQNSRAEKVAPLLQQAFTGRASAPSAAAPPTVAPGTPAGSIVSPPAFGSQSDRPPTPAAAAAVGAAVGAAAGAAGAAAARPGEPGGIVRNLQAVADKDNNTIIIVATPGEYAVIESALKRLDMPARQVVIELTIAEIVLSDTIQFGVEWLFTGSDGRVIGGNVTNPQAPASGGTDTTISGLLTQGFTAILRNSAFPGGVQAALRLLDTYGNTKVISNPHLSALDNQKATIKVGDKIPICTETFLAGTIPTSGNTVQTTSQYIDTGVLVQVTPHINAGGLVTLEVQAEVSTPGATTRQCEAPPINTRSVQTYVAVNSGETMVMGGLIADRARNASSGLPLLSRIPYWGGLFGTQEVAKDRTELVLFITPRVVESAFDARSVIDDLRRRMERLESAYPVRGGVPTMPVAPPVFVAPR